RARPHFGSRPPSAAWFHSAALASALSGQIGKAVHLLEEGVASHPHAAALHNNLAVALMAVGRDDEARAALDRGVQEDPGLAVLHRNRGDLLLSEGRGDLALEEYLRAVKQHETLGPEVWARIGTLRAAQGDMLEATAAWERALALDPSHAGAAQALASARGEA